jgi:hypothetical protein
MIGHPLDILLLVSALGIPAFCVFRWRRYGIISGTALFWILSLLCSKAWRELHKPPDSADALLFFTALWMFGWLFGLIYCSMVALLKQAILFGRRGFVLYQEEKKRDAASRGKSLVVVWKKLNDDGGRPHLFKHIIGIGLCSGLMFLFSMWSVRMSLETFVSGSATETFTAGEKRNSAIGNACLQVLLLPGHLLGWNGKISFGLCAVIYGTVLYAAIRMMVTFRKQLKSSP